jgi:hypothetical protein
VLVTPDHQAGFDGINCDVVSLFYQIREEKGGGVMVAAEASGGSAMRTPAHLWIVGVLALLWNAMGAFDYLATQFRLEFYMGKFEPQMLEYFYGIPSWAIAGWAIAVWFALAGSIGLLLRKCWSVWAFGISIVGMVLSTVHGFFLSEGLEIMGDSYLYMTILVWIIAIGLFFYARAMSSKGVLT